MAAYVAARKTYLTNLVDKLSYVEDAITGNRLRIDDQLVFIGINADDGKSEVGLRARQNPPLPAPTPPNSRPHESGEFHPLSGRGC